jgi:hypothetical protein
MFLGQRTRCIACAKVFVASPDLAPPATPHQEEPPANIPVKPLAEPSPPPRLHPPMLPAEIAGRSRHRQPLCPCCHRPVSWEALDCPHCGHLFDPLDAHARGEWLRRRDSDTHRGQLIDNLGTFSMFGGALALCTGPLGILLALTLGIPTLIMAGNDLEKMRAGAVDPEGRSLTEFGRNKAIVGIVLAMLFGLFFLLAWMEWYR